MTTLMRVKAAQPLQVAFDLHDAADGEFRLEAYDLPDTTRQSTVFSQTSADLTTEPPPAPAGHTRLLLTEALLTRHSHAALSPRPRTFYLYAYRPNDREELLAFERRIEPHYADYYAKLHVLYAGLFDVVSGLDDGYVAEILAFDRTLDDAKAFVHAYEPASDIAAIEDECRTLQNREDARYLFWLSR